MSVIPIVQIARRVRRARAGGGAEPFRVGIMQARRTRRAIWTEGEEWEGGEW